MPLTVSDIENAVPGEKRIRRSDGKGLYIEIAPAGGKWWRLKYRYHGRDKRLALGVYPEVGLTEARTRRDAARKLLAQGIDPGEVKREQKAREKADWLAAKNASTVKVCIALDGAVEVWKGGAVTRLSPDEAQGVKQLLIKLTV